MIHVKRFKILQQESEKLKMDHGQLQIQLMKFKVFFYQLLL